jgi:acyl-CoA reductase-like NAD-dependent aldehyde dehydrogenase
LQNLPPGVIKTTVGDAEAMEELFGSFALAIATGILCIYVVLVLLFHAWALPVTILVALVLSVPGAILALFVTGKDLTMPAMIGMILQYLGTMLTATAIVREPIGVCALITPWNWPIYQITAKVGPALAAGCTVVLKPSELSPLSALLFAEIVHEAGIPAGVFNLVNGSGPEVGAAMSLHPQVDMISITGSTRAGVLVAQAAAVTVKRVAQELGGKSPNVVLPDADLDRAIPPGVAAAFRNMGQSCSAPTRLIVPRAALDRVHELALATLAQMKVGDPTDAATTHGPLANRAQFLRVQQMIEAGMQDGARLLAGGAGRPDGLEQGYYARPTIFSDVHTDMVIAQEEIFGPVLAILPYDTVEEAIAIANDTVYGLGAHVQGSDKDQVRAVAARIQSGQVHLNYPAWDPQAPFGGYKQSGNGREYGVEGMEEYMEVKSILGYYA